MLRKIRWLALTLPLLSAAAPAGALAEIPFVKEALTVQMPYGESAFTLWHNTRVPHEFNQPILFFTDKAGTKDADTRLMEQLGIHGGWALLLDLKRLEAKIHDDAQFIGALDALARAVKGKMSEAMGPRLRGMPERNWPVTFGGRGAGAVRAAEAAIKYKDMGGVRGLMLINPAEKASALNKKEAPRVLRDLFSKLDVTPVVFIAPPGDERLHALGEHVIGYHGLRATPLEALSYIAGHYQIRNRKAPGRPFRGGNPADLFRPGGR